MNSFIRKYPPKITGIQESDIGIYYYTFRDINSLVRNTGFHTKKEANSIVIQLKDFYKYAYLCAFKKLFQPKERWLYGNLSPLGGRQFVEDNKTLFINYTLLSEQKVFYQLESKTVNKILLYKKRKLLNYNQIEKIVSDLINNCQ